MTQEEHQAASAERPVVGREAVAFLRAPIPEETLTALVDWLEATYGEGLGMTAVDESGFVHVYRNVVEAGEEA